MDFEQELSLLQSLYINNDSKLWRATKNMTTKYKAEIINKLATVVDMDNFIIYVIIEMGKIYHINLSPTQIGNAFLFKNNGLILFLNAIKDINYEDVGKVLNRLLEKFPDNKILYYNIETYLMGGLNLTDLAVIRIELLNTNHPNANKLKLKFASKFDERETMKLYISSEKLEVYNYLCIVKSPKYIFQEWEVNFFKECIIQFPLTANFKYLITHMAVSSNVSFLKWALDLSLKHLENKIEVSKYLSIYNFMYEIVIQRKLVLKYTTNQTFEEIHHIYSNDWFKLGQNSILSLTDLFNVEAIDSIMYSLSITSGEFNGIVVLNSLLESTSIHFDNSVLKIAKLLKTREDYTKVKRILMEETLGVLTKDDFKLPVILKTVACMDNDGLNEFAYERCNLIVADIINNLESMAEKGDRIVKRNERCLAFSLEILLNCAAKNTRTNKDWQRVIDFTEVIIQSNYKFTVCEAEKHLEKYMRAIFLEFHPNIRSMIAERCRRFRVEVHSKSRLRNSIEHTTFIQAGLNAAPDDYRQLWIPEFITILLNQLMPNKPIEELVIVLNILQIIMNHFRKHTTNYILNVIMELMAIKRHHNECQFNSTFFRLYSILVDRFVGSANIESALSQMQLYKDHERLLELHQFLIDCYPEEERRLECEESFTLFLILLSKTNNNFPLLLDNFDLNLKLFEVYFKYGNYDYNLSEVYMKSFINIVPISKIKEVFSESYTLTNPNAERDYLLFLAGLLNKFKEWVNKLSIVNQTSNISEMEVKLQAVLATSSAHMTIMNEFLQGLSFHIVPVGPV